MSTPTPQQRLDAALRYARRGWHIFPVHAWIDGRCTCGKMPCGDAGKHPCTPNGLKNATTNERTIREWWGRWPHANIGLRCGAESGVWAIDLDTPEAVADYEALRREWTGVVVGDPLPPGPRVQTQGGGLHVYRPWVPEMAGTKNQARRRGTQIDQRVQDGYVVLPPSTGKDGDYREVTGHRLDQPLSPPVAEEVAWAHDPPPAAPPQTPAPPPRALATSATDAPDRPTVLAWASNYLAKADPAVNGAGGSDRAFWAARLLVRGWGLTEAEALGILMVEYNPRCGAAEGKRALWTEAEFRHKLRDAATAAFDKPQNWLLNERLEFNRKRAEGRRPSAAERRHQAAAEGTAGDPAGGAIPSAVAELDAWPDPLPFDEPTPPPAMPLDEVFDPRIAAFFRSVSAGTNAPAEVAATYGLGFAAGAVGRTLQLELTPEWRERACLYCCVVADPSSKKSPVFDAVFRPLAAEHERFDHEWQASGRGGMPRIVFVNDTTVEPIPRVIADQPRGFLYARDEISGWFKAFNQFKGGKGSDREFWLSNHSGGRISKLRSNEDHPYTYAPDTCISVVGAVQPEVLAQLQADVKDGMIARFLMTFARPWPPARLRRERYEHEDHWRDTLVALLGREMAKHPELGPRATVVHTTDAALDLFDDWQARAVEVDDRLTSTKTKLDGSAARLALVLHALEHPPGRGTVLPNLSADTMRRGILLARWFLTQAEYALAVNHRAPATGTAKKVLDWIRRKKLTTFTRRHMYRSLDWLFEDSWEAVAPLRVLEDRGFVQRLDAERKNSDVYAVNPKCL